MSYAFRLISAFAVLAGFLAAPATAADQWTLVQAVGEVSVAAPGATPVAAKPASPLPDGATVRTGATGRAVLLRGRETIVMSPLSAITLPSGAKRDFTKVQQQSGTLLFKIGKKPEAHFEVDTPYLAAVVKGTTFTVKVGSAGASVHVLEGAVEVATADRKSSFLTKAGQISSVFAKTAGDIFTTGASVLSNPAASSELWDGGDFSFSTGEGVSPWSMGRETRVITNAGLTRKTAPPRKDEPLTDRAPERLAKAAKEVDETLGAAKARQQSQKPKDGLAKDSDHRQTERPDAPAKKAERKADPARKPATAAKSGDTGGAPKPSNVWTVTQSSGDITIDGYPFAKLDGGNVKTLPPGTKIETGPESRLGVAHGMRSYVIEANSLAILADPNAKGTPMVVSGAAVQYREEAGRYEKVDNLTPEQVAELRASGALDAGPAQDGSEGSLQLAGGTAGGASVSGSPIPTAPAPIIMQRPTNTKTEEVRTKVIGGLTLGLYGLTALLVLTFGAQWMWRRYKAKAKAPQQESIAQTRLRNIKGT